jgi:tetrapyrrole methylase family protein/MazG family protein
MTDFEFKDRYDFSDLMHIVRILRAPGGCPWDRAQTHESIRRNFIEETCEAVEAIDNGDPALLCEELGDVLMQVALHSEMSEESGDFTIDDVTDGVCKKLIFRHPHVFGDLSAPDAEQAVANWDKLKRVEKGQETYTETLTSVARTLPALWRAEKIQKKAAKAGMTAMSESEAAEALAAEAARFCSGSGADVGRLLFAAVRCAQMRGVDPEDALNAACDDFVDRFSKAESAAGDGGLDALGADEKAALWKRINER